MNPLLNSIKLKRMPADPVGFIPLIAKGITSLESAGGISFLPIPVRSPEHDANMPINLIEILPSAEEAQQLLEFYLARLESPCGMGAIRPVTLDEVFYCLTEYQIAMNNQLAEPVRKLLIHMDVLPVVVCYSQKAWNDTALAQINYQLFGLIGPGRRAAVGDLSRYLQAVRSNKISGKSR